MPALKLYLLGTLDMRCNGQALSRPATLKSQLLLAYLVLHRNQPQPRARLAVLFWGDRPERKARRSLTTALWHIRRALPKAEELLAEPHTVQFDPQANLWLDVDEFQTLAGHQDLAHLKSAAALYRGALLEGFYDEWILTIRYRLKALFADVLTRLMVGQEAAGEYQAALNTARLLLDHDPFREDAHRLAMQTFCRLGQRSAALEQYRRCQETVQREFNAQPMVETTELYQAILEGRFEIGPPGQPTLALPVRDLPPLGRGYNPLDAAALPPLVGRERKMAFLQDRYVKASQGRGGLVLVGGEAGVGKTRLVGELARKVRWQGDSVLSGRCYEFERFLPYQPLAEALGGVVPTMSQLELDAHPAWVLAQVARLVPGLPERMPWLGTTPPLRSN